MYFRDGAPWQQREGWLGIQDLKVGYQFKNYANQGETRDLMTEAAMVMETEVRYEEGKEGKPTRLCGLYGYMIYCRESICTEA